MKKLFSVILLVCMIPVFAFAADLSDLSFDELIKLRDEINAEIVSRPEWKETEIPAGQWIVGEDIPAGSYSISVDGKQSLVQIWKKAVNDYVGGLLFNEIIKDKYGRIKLEAGWIFTNNRPVIFSPPDSLGF